MEISSHFIFAPRGAQAYTLPFADGFFDAIVSMDAYHYFGTDDLYSLLPGEDLLTWGHRVPAAERNRIEQHALHAVAWLHRLTSPVCEELNGAELPRRTLSFERQAIIDKGGP